MRVRIKHSSATDSEKKKKSILAGIQVEAICTSKLHYKLTL